MIDVLIIAAGGVIGFVTTRYLIRRHRRHWFLVGFGYGSEAMRRTALDELDRHERGHVLDEQRRLQLENAPWQ